MSASGQHEPKSCKASSPQRRKGIWLYSTLTLIPRQHLPSSHNHIVEDLQGNVWDMVSQSLLGKGRTSPARTFRLGV